MLDQDKAHPVQLCHTAVKIQMPRKSISGRTLPVPVLLQSTRNRKHHCPIVSKMDRQLENVHPIPSAAPVKKWCIYGVAFKVQSPPAMPLSVTWKIKCLCSPLPEPPPMIPHAPSMENYRTQEK